MATRQVNVCTAGECGGECYACRLRDADRRAAEMERKLAEAERTIEGWRSQNAKLQDELIAEHQCRTEFANLLTHTALKLEDVAKQTADTLRKIADDIFQELNS